MPPFRFSSQPLTLILTLWIHTLWLPYALRLPWPWAIFLILLEVIMVESMLSLHGLRYGRHALIKLEACNQSHLWAHTHASMQRIIKPKCRRLCAHLWQLQWADQTTLYWIPKAQRSLWHRWVCHCRTQPRPETRLTKSGQTS